eukprot:1158219-Pelagomonas_calceolata.AAC.6
MNASDYTALLARCIQNVVDAMIQIIDALMKRAMYVGDRTALLEFLECEQCNGPILRNLPGIYNER